MSNLNCAERLVAIFGSQAKVARAFRLDRAVVNNWEKSGYVPARGEVEVEGATGGGISYPDPIFVEMMEELNSLLRYASQTKNPLTFPVSGPGSVGMEYCFVNLVKPDDKVIVCKNGVFGGRMVENVERAGGVAVAVEDAWGAPVDAQKLEGALKKNRDARIVAFGPAGRS